jgi:RNA-directed DNA polymerase
MSLRLTDDDATLKARFSTLTDLEDVAVLLDVTSKELRFYLYKAKKYQQFEIRKKSGGTRLISSPANALKIIQWKLNQVLHAVYRGRAPVHGFARDKSIRSNASRHLGCALLLNFDLADFFPSIHFGRVMGMFHSKPYSLPEQAARVLAQICCYNKALPAGAPTSPIVANMVCGRMDSQLKELASRFRCTYTRYADDITFSTKQTRFPPAVAHRDPDSKRWALGDQLQKIVTDNGFTINASKTRGYSRGTRLEVTGLTINERVNVRRKLVRQVRAMLAAWEKHGLEAAQADFSAKWDTKQRRKAPADFGKVVRGKIDFIGFIRGRDDGLFLRFLSRYAELDTGATIRPITLGPRASDDVLRQAVWLLEDDDGNQGTAFATDGYGILTAWHVAIHPVRASRPSLSPKTYEVTVVRKSEDVDLAQIEIKGPVPVTLPMGNADTVKLGDNITLLGYPRYRVGDGVHLDRGRITQSRVYFGVPHFVIGPVIVRGNSGGPILDQQNRIVGVAVKGLGTPGRFSAEDELSSFVPTSMLKHMK